jgi:L-ribulokinase
MRASIGLDFGTESARVAVVDLDTQETTFTAVHRYAHGVLDRALPHGEALPPDWALQVPGDWLHAAETLLAQAAGRLGGAHLVGLGVSFTSCTCLAVDEDGRPLCESPDLAGEPLAYAILWKHHAAQPYADRMNASSLWQERLSWTGGLTSSEWLVAKAAQVAAEAPTVWARARWFIEGGDWLVWRLTGRQARSACQAGYKAHWLERDGYPTSEMLDAVQPGLSRLADDWPAPLPVGSAAGGLSGEWAGPTGLPEGLPVGVAVIDAHAAVPAVGVGEPGTLVAILGTSACHVLVGPEVVKIPGISGVVPGGVLPGLAAYEAGQNAFGDALAWTAKLVLGRSGSAEFGRLEELAAESPPARSGIVGLDWFNGARTPLVDASLRGALLGLRLDHGPGDLYRAVVEAVCLGTRWVVDTFRDGGVSVDTIVATGGIAERSRFLTRTLADATRLAIVVPAVEHASAVGAALYGAAAGGEDLGELAARRARLPARRLAPSPESGPGYDELYTRYRSAASKVRELHLAWRN